MARCCRRHYVRSDGLYRPSQAGTWPQEPPSSRAGDQVQRKPEQAPARPCSSCRFDDCSRLRAFKLQCLGNRVGGRPHPHRCVAGERDDQPEANRGEGPNGYEQRDQEHFEGDVCREPEALARESTLAGSNEVGSARPAWVDDRELVQGAAEGHQGQPGRDGGQGHNEVCHRPRFPRARARLRPTAIPDSGRASSRLRGPACDRHLGS